MNYTKEEIAKLNKGCVQSELRDGEIFIANVSKDKGIPEYFRGLKTVRLGQEALDINGNPLTPEEGYVPLFVHKSEYLELNKLWERRITESARDARNGKYA